MSRSGRWDAQRARTKGATGAGVPKCARCKRPSVLDPCRACATPAELKQYPAAPVPTAP